MTMAPEMLKGQSRDRLVL